MFKKLVFCLIIIFSISILSSSQFACPFLFINPSARDAAFGLESGTAGLRYLSAASASNNPAKLGAFSGVCIERSSYEYAIGAISSSKLIVGWKGIGINLPFINIVKELNSDLLDLDFDLEFGTNRKHGIQQSMNAEGEVTDVFFPVEHHLEFAVGVDVVYWTKQFISNDTLERYSKDFKLYFGYSRNYINSDIAPDDVSAFSENDLSIDGKSGFNEFGLLTGYNFKQIQSEYDNLNFTFGIDFINPEKAKIIYVNESQADYLPYGIKYGFSGNYSKRTDKFDNQFLGNFTDKAYVIYASYDEANYGGIRKIQGFGAELSLLNILSYRIGRTTNRELDASGSSYSLGLNLKYRNQFGIAVDYTKMFDSSEIYSPEKLNFAVNFNFR